MNKRIRGENWLELEAITQEMFEKMDLPSMQALDEAVKPYRNTGYNTKVYDLHLQNAGYVPKPISYGAVGLPEDYEC